MISAEEREYILRNAYVPEHGIGLMTSVSRGEPYLVEEHLGFKGDGWYILVGYALDGQFSEERCERVFRQAVAEFKPTYLWFIGPTVPGFLDDSCATRESDRYYRIGPEWEMPRGLERSVRRGARDLSVAEGWSWTGEHEALVHEFLRRQTLPPLVRELYRSMAAYVTSSDTSLVLEARNPKGRLTAFFVLDLEPERFATYVVGCYSRKWYVSHASDLLFARMIELARERGKETVNLGLGVNPGIRRFKEKWGGAPFLAYEFCEYRSGLVRAPSLIRLLEGKL